MSLSSKNASYLSAEQFDALRELFNIGFGRAAASLAQLIDHRIALSPPELHVCALQEIAQHLPSWLQQQVIRVHQHFEGPFAGQANMLIRAQDTQRLLKLLGHNNGVRISASDIDAVVELGNIVLSAFVATLHQVTQARFAFAPPQGQIFTRFSPSRLWFPLPEAANNRVAILAFAHFEVAGEDIRFLLLIILDLAALQALTNAFESFTFQ